MAAVLEIDGDPLPDERRRRTLLLSAVGVAAVLTGIGVVLLTGGDDGEEVEVALRAPRAVQSLTAPVAPAPKVVPPLPTTPSTRLGRNPFDLPNGVVLSAPERQVSALDAAPAQVPAQVPVDQPGQVPDVPLEVPLPSEAAAPVIPSAPITDAAVPLPAPAAPARPAAVPTATAPTTAPSRGSTSLTLTKVSGSGAAQRARFRVDGVPVTVAVGHRFGPTAQFLLLSLVEGAGDRWTAVVRVGDAQPRDLPQNVTMRLR